MTRWASFLVVATVLLGGCSSVYVASVRLNTTTEAGLLTLGDEQGAAAAVAEAATALGFSPSPETLEQLRKHQPSEVYPYRSILFMERWSGTVKVTLHGEVKLDRTEIRFDLRDLAHGDSTPLSNRVIAAVRNALEDRFPRHTIERGERSSIRFFAP